MRASARDLLIASLAALDAEIYELDRQHRELVEATAGANADDEHDPEGSTLAFERQQLVAVATQHRASRAEVQQALSRLAAGTYGICVCCRALISAERLLARPQTGTCMSCARNETSV